MKIFVLFAITAACIASSYTAPAGSADAISWSSVRLRVDELSNVVRNGFLLVSTTAQSANPAVGAQVNAKLNAATAKINPFLDVINTGVGNQDLTRTQASTNVRGIKDTVGSTALGLQYEMNQLPPLTAARIYEMFNDMLDNIDRKGNDLDFLLRG